MPSYRETPELAHQLQALVGIYGTKTDVITEAVSELYARHFPTQEPYVMTWQSVVLAHDAVCSDLGTPLPRGTHAYQEVWSDGRTGEIVSRAALLADGVIFDD